MVDPVSPYTRILEQKSNLIPDQSHGVYHTLFTDPLLQEDKRHQTAVRVMLTVFALVSPISFRLLTAFLLPYLRVIDVAASG